MMDFISQTGEQRQYFREQNYGRVSYPKSLTSVSNGGKMKMDNISVRKWYHNHIHNIPNEIEQSLSIEEKAKSAFELRNKYRIMVR